MSGSLPGLEAGLIGDDPEHCLRILSKERVCAVGMAKDVISMRIALIYDSKAQIWVKCKSLI